MPYQINDGNGAYLGEPRSLPNRGPKPKYPFIDMYIGQWIEVPYAEERRLLRAVSHIRQAYGLVFNVLQAPNGNWVAVRIA